MLIGKIFTNGFSEERVYGAGNIDSIGLSYEGLRKNSFKCLGIGFFKKISQPNDSHNQDKSNNCSSLQATIQQACYRYNMIKSIYMSQEKQMILLIDKLQQMKRIIRNQDRSNSGVRQLVTQQQEQMYRMESCLAQRKSSLNVFKMEQSFEEDQDLQESLGHLKQTDVEKMAVLINQLIAKNKVSAKNAFEIPLIALQDTRQFKNGFGDNSWKSLSSTLENDYKIYGYRVDATHNYTYRMLESISRQQTKDEEDNQQKNDRMSLKRQKNGLIQQIVSCDLDNHYSKYLERNCRNINITHIETFFNASPVIEKTRRIFDQHGIDGLLLNNIEINNRLELIINLGSDILKQPQEQPAQHTAEHLLQICWQSALPHYNIFKQIQENCRGNHFLVQEQDVECLLKQQTNQIETLWKELQECDKVNKVELKQQHAIIAKDLNNNPNLKKQNLDKPIQMHQQVAIQNNVLPLELGQEKDHKITQESLLQHMKEKETPLLCKISQQPHNLPASETTFNNIQCQNTIQSFQNIVQKPRTKISSIIRIKNKNQSSISTDIILKQINDFQTDEPHQHIDLVKRWKNTDKKIIVRKAKKQKKPLSQYIQFLNDTKKISRSSMFLIDKSKRKEIKRLMKCLNSDSYRDCNSLIDASRWKIDFKMSTLLAEHKPNAAVINSIVDQQVQNQLQDNPNNINSFIDLDCPISLSDDEMNLYRRKTNISIRKAKDIIREIIFSQEKQIEFLDLYGRLATAQVFISPALCFLTVLHLANQNSFVLQNCQNQYNYRICKP